MKTKSKIEQAKEYSLQKETRPMMETACRSFIAGWDACEQSTWVDASEETPDTDGQYITAVVQGERVTIEMAPWRNGRYNGSLTMAVYFGMATVLYWMPIPEFIIEKALIYENR